MINIDGFESELKKGDIGSGYVFCGLDEELIKSSIDPIIKKVVDLFIPKEKTKEYRKDTNLLKDAASKQKLETLYINRILCSILVFIVSLMIFGQVHNVAIDYIYENPTTKFDMLRRT